MRGKRSNIKMLGYIIIVLCIPAIILIGSLIFKDKQYAFITAAVAVAACIPFFVAFERSKHKTAELVIIAVMVALSTLGRIIFFAVPGFKPVTAVVVLTAMYFGSEAGFMTGSLSAVLSNFYFRQGPWTPFQMLSWGLIGFFAGVLSKRLRANRILLFVYGAISGVLYSLVMDVWTTLWADDVFNLSRYVALVITSAPFILMYAVSNVAFLAVLQKPIGQRIERINTKYGL